MSTDNPNLRLALRRDAERRAVVPQFSPPPQPSSGVKQEKTIKRIIRGLR